MKFYIQCLFNLVQNFIISNQYAIIFNYEGDFFYHRFQNILCIDSFEVRK